MPMHPKVPGCCVTQGVASETLCQQQLQGTTLGATQDMGKNKIKGAHGTGTNLITQVDNCTVPCGMSSNAIQAKI